MSDNLNDNKETIQDNSDNLTHSGDMDEALANVLNTDDSRTSGAPLSEGEDEEMEKLRSEIAEAKDKHLRLIAEFENYKRRTSKERLEERQLAGKEIVQSLLVVLDDMGRAEKQIANSSDVESIKSGLELVFSKLKTILHQRGLKVMDAVNAEFDADLHEAITEIPAPTEDMKGKVIDVVEPGYYLNEKLIRYAKVVVGN